MPPWLAPLIAAPFIGSFAGVLIRRLPRGRPVALARSACEHCDATLTPREMVPLLSYAWQGGRCRHCRAPIGRFHPAIELAALAVALIVVVVAGDDDQATLWAGCLLGWWLLTLAWIDAETFRLPDPLTLGLLLAGLAVTWGLEPESLAEHAWAAIAAYLGFRAVALIYRRLRGREGLGEGDAKLLAAAGAWVGLAPLSQVILLAGVIGLGMALAMARRQGLSATLAVPFGPALAAAIWIVWLHQRQAMLS